jgi:hypothetical protein
MKQETTSKRSVVWRLLRRNISAGQLIGYAVANFIGLAIVLTGLQFYRDVNSGDDADDPMISRDYLILSKRVDGFGSMGGETADFKAGDIANLEAQPWVARVGQFTASDFNVSATIEMGGRSMSTYLFFESIPDDFFDVQPAGWKFNPADRTVPIILSKDYLTLYNFGFAASRGLPQVSEAMIGMVPLRISISGNGSQQWLRGRVVGFSSRLNTIAVPQEFMDWANQRYGEGDSAAPSRLIVEVNTPGDPQIADYLQEHNLESAGDKVDNGRAAYFLSVVTGVVIAVGVVISVLAFFILLLSIYLLLQKSRAKLRDLMLLGYTPHSVAVYYYRMVTVTNIVVTIGAIAVMAAARGAWLAPLTRLGLGGDSLLATVVVAIAIFVVITLLNVVAIRRNIARTWHNR